MLVPVITEATRTEEEEDRLLAALIQQDHDGKVEYKILHGPFGAFRNSERMQATLDEEARSQWELALKLDDQRLVLRRPRDARSRDAYRDAEVDPYRTELATGRTSSFLVAIVAVVIAGLLAWVLFGGVTGGLPVQLALLAVGVGASVLVLIALIIIVRRRSG